ncbi:MAG: lanthionine synthetase C family protein [Bacteroidota bacterium]
MDHWKTIVDGIDKEEVIQKIREISTVLESIPDKEIYSSTGLLVGSSGIGLFFLNMAKVYDDEKYYAKLGEVIEKSVDVFANDQTQFSICYGAAGLGWLINHAVKNDLMDAVDAEDILQYLDNYLAPIMVYEMKRGNYDFLHGALGVAIYFLSREKADHEKYIIEVIKELEKLAVVESNGMVKWPFFHVDKIEDNRFNLGLSHGIPSIISFLSKAQESNILPDTCTHLIEGATNYVLSKAYDFDSKGCYWDYFVDDDSGPYVSRLAWCYGDIGIANVLLEASQVLQNSELKAKSIDIFKKTATRQDPQKNQIWDSCFCHGASGLAYIFQKAFNQTGLVDLKEAATHWTKVSLRLANHKDGYAGYKMYGANQSFEDKPGYLEGISGVGLSLLAAAHSEVSGWDESLLL